MIKTVPSVCCSDCGGSCPLNIYVEDGKIIRIEAHDVGLPAMRPCSRGLLYHYRVYAPDRVKYPLKRNGERGEGKFVRISWEQALNEIAEQLTRIRDTYGPASIINLAWMGSSARLHNLGAVARFLSMAGGYTRLWGSTSHQGGHFTSWVTYGNALSGNARADLVNSRLIILWGCNPSEPVWGTETRWYLTQARDKGIKIICIDPRFSNSAATWASQWIPILPGTDAAMMVAMAYVILERRLPDQRFLDTYTVGFDKFRDYVLGKEDGVAKTPEWAEKITGVPAGTIRALALEYATTKPAALITGYAPGRTSRGEQYHRAAITLSAMTGNIGIHGGFSACADRNPSTAPVVPGVKPITDYLYMYSEIPLPPNPVEVNAPLHQCAVKGIQRHTVDKIHTTKVWDAILKGKAGGYYSNYKMLYVTGGDGLNQFTDTNSAAAAMRKLEFVVVHDHFITPTARFADIVLPATTWCERNDIKPVRHNYAFYVNKAIEPVGEARSDIDIFGDLAARMGIYGYNDKTEDEWLRLFAARHGIPDYEAFKASGFYNMKPSEPYVAFQPQIQDPEHNPFPTPSGKIEIFSQLLADFNHPDELPPIPKYVEGWEGPTDPKYKKYPLQLITPHSKRRTHSQFHNIPWFRQLEPHEVWISSVDAKARKIKNHDMVRVFNDRGAISILARVTERIMPGVVSIYQGAWYDPDPSGLDRGGCANVLTRGEHSPAGVFCSNTSLVQIERT